MSTISQDKKKRRFRPDSKFWTRVLVIILLAAMLAGTCFYMVYFLVNAKEAEVNETEVLPEDGYTVRVALEYGSSVAVSFRTAADNGCIYGLGDSDNGFTPLGELESTVLHVACSENLVFNGDSGDFEACAEGKTPSVGGYHIMLGGETGILTEYIPLLKEALGTEIFGALLNGEKKIMIGSFGSEADAEEYRQVLLDRYCPVPEETTEEDPETEESLPEESDAEETSEEETSAGETLSEETSAEETSGEDSDDPGETVPEEPEEPAGPDPLTVAVSGSTVFLPAENVLVLIDGATNGIRWMYLDETGTQFLCLRAIQKGDGSLTYIRGYSSERKYDGTLDFCAVSGVDGEPYHGVRVIDVLPLETYIMGVVPYEIGNAWPLESQKAQAIAARSYVVANLGHHKKSYNADVCCSQDCQVFKGFGSTNDRVRQACTETKGMIAVYKGTICNCMYSSSTGGCTASRNDHYGGTSNPYPYLSAVATPWEKYASHGNGSWTKEFTPAELYERLKSKGYTGLKGNIASVTLTYGKNTTYANKAVITDVKGNSVTLSNGSKIRSAFGVNSANFIIGKAGKKVSQTNYTMMGFGAKTNEPTIGMNVKSNPFDFTVLGRQVFSVLTGSGIVSHQDTNSEYVMTAEGLKSYNMSMSLDSQYYPTMLGTGGQVLPDVFALSPIKETETVTLNGTSGNFVLVGRGWGHGLGMSQYGAYDMAKLGYDYETIIKSYYSGVDIVSFVDFLK